MTTDRSWTEASRAASTQVLFREVNDRVRELAAEFGTPRAQWVCECARDNCFEHILMPVEDYDSVRAEPDVFVVAPSDEHVFRDLDTVVRRTNDYWVVRHVDPDPTRP